MVIGDLCVGVYFTEGTFQHDISVKIKCFSYKISRVYMHTCNEMFKRELHSSFRLKEFCTQSIALKYVQSWLKLQY